MLYVSSLSGGRDSTAMTVRLLELGAPLDYILFTDTGYELPQMYEYIDKLNGYLKRKFKKQITTIDPTTTIEAWAFSQNSKGEHKGRKRGLPVSVGMSYCTRELKVNQNRRFIADLGLKPSDVCFYVGYVARENRKAADFGWAVKYPLKEWGWNEPEVTEYLKQKGIYNHLYDDFSRTGCFCCPKQSLGSWQVIFLKYPKLWQWCKDMEKRARDENCLIQTWRADGIPLEVREKQWVNLKLQSDFEFDWTDTQVSCFCK